MRVEFGGLFNSFEKAKTPMGRAHWSYNCRTERGVAEAWPGFGRVWPAPATTNYGTGKTCVGAGYGRWGGVDEIVWMETLSGSARLRSLNAGTGTVTTYDSVAAWSSRNTGDWGFAQFENYIYGINQTDGLWRKKIGDTTSGSWERVNVLQVDLTREESQARLERPAPQYTISSQWNAGDLAGTLSADMGPSYSNTAGSNMLSSVSGGKLRMEYTGDTTSLPDNELRATFTFTTALNLSSTRYWYVVMEVFPITGGAEGVWSANDAGEPSFLDTGPWDVFCSTDASAPGGDWTDAKWRKARAYPVFISTIPTSYGEGRYYQVGLSIDFDHLEFKNTGADVLDSIKKIGFGVRVKAGNDFTWSISPPFRGGTWMSKPRYYYYMDGADAFQPNGWQNYQSEIRDLEYAVVSYTTTPSDTESAASVSIIPGIDAVGQPFRTGGLPLGVRVNINYPAPAPGYTGIRIYRRRQSDSRKWYRIADITSGSAGTYTDSLVDAVSDYVAWPTTAVRTENYDFGASFQDIAGASVLAAWKGHLVIGAGREVYFSYLGDPTKYLKPVRLSGIGSRDPEDITVGRTLYVANDAGDTVLSLVAQEALYAVCERGVYVLTGDVAATATPFILLPSSYGGLSSQSAAAYMGGCVVASQTGLYWYYATQSGDQGFQQQELTQEVRGSWRWLLAGTGTVSVGAYESELEITKGTRVLRRNRSGQWEMGEYPAATLAANGAGTNDWSLYGSPTGFDGTVYGISGTPTGSTGKQSAGFSLPELNP